VGHRKGAVIRELYRLKGLHSLEPSEESLVGDLTHTVKQTNACFPPGCRKFDHQEQPNSQIWVSTSTVTAQRLWPL